MIRACLRTAQVVSQLTIKRSTKNAGKCATLPLQCIGYRDGTDSCVANRRCLLHIMSCQLILAIPWTFSYHMLQCDCVHYPSSAQVLEGNCLVPAASRTSCCQRDHCWLQAPTENGTKEEGICKGFAGGAKREGGDCKACYS